MVICPERATDTSPGQARLRAPPWDTIRKRGGALKGHGNPSISSGNEGAFQRGRFPCPFRATRFLPINTQGGARRRACPGLISTALHRAKTSDRRRQSNCCDTSNANPLKPSSFTVSRPFHQASPDHQSAWFADHPEVAFGAVTTGVAAVSSWRASRTHCRFRTYSVPTRKDGKRKGYVQQHVSHCDAVDHKAEWRIERWAAARPE